MRIGKSLRALRTRQGLTLKDLSALSGVSSDDIARYERGEVQPRAENVSKLSAALEEPFDTIRNGVCWTQDKEEWEIPGDQGFLNPWILQVLAEAYGTAEPGVFKDSRGHIRTCVTVGTPPNSFLLFKEDLEELAESVISSVEPLMDQLAAQQGEKEIISKFFEQDRRKTSPDEPFDLTDEQWEALRNLLPPERTGRGRAFKDNRLMLNGILYWMRTGIPWRNLPKRFGRFRSVYDRLRLWNDSGVWPQVLAKLLELGVIREEEIVVDSTRFQDKQARGTAPSEN